MDGLEAVEILKSTVISESPELRIESEYYLKEYLQLSKKISAIKNEKIMDFAYVTDGIHTSIDFDDDSNINLLSAKSPKDNYFNLSGNGYISANQHKTNQRTALKDGDVIISTVGTIGNCAVVDSTILPANSDRHVGIIRTNNNYKPHYLSTFLISKYGRFQSKRYTTGNVQPNLFIDKINKIVVPFISENFQNKIDELVVNALHIREQSKQIYNSTEEQLMSMLIKNDFVLTTQSVSVKLFSNSFKIKGRLDAEYYQPKYDEYEKVVSTYTGGYVRVRDKFQPVKTKCLRNLDEYNYVEIGDVNVENGSYVSNIVATEDLPANAKIVAQNGDLIVSTVRPNRGAVSILDESNLLVSSAFTVLRQNSNYPKEILQVLFRTEIYRDWLLKYNVGTSYPVIKDDDVLNMLVPLFDDKTQNQVVQKIKESQEYRQHSKMLLEKAKRAVEIAIEQGEDKAINFLKCNGQALL